MPTPVGHSLMGLILYTNRKRVKWELTWKDGAIFVVVANIADIDFLPGIITGNPNQFHHGMTHSIFFAIIVGFIFGLIYYLQKKNFLQYFLMFSTVYCSHLLLDLLGKDTKFPFGIQLFWPFSKIYVMSPVAIFNDVYKASSTDIFLLSLFNRHNLETVLFECIILLPILGLMRFFYNKKELV